MIKMIVATDLNNGIGINGNLPWRIKEDLQHFSKNATNFWILQVLIASKK